MWLPMDAKGSEGYLYQFAGDRPGRTVGVGACGICFGRVDRHGGCGHMEGVDTCEQPHLNVDVFGTTPSTIISVTWR